MIANPTAAATTRLHSGRVLELDGLRAFAILPVMFSHCYPENAGLITFAGKAGWIGVDLFFVLSGYLITGILLKAAGQPHYYRNFIARRTIRIFPLYYVCLILFTAAVYWTGGDTLAGFRAWGGAKWFVFYLGNIRAAIAGFPQVFSFVPLWSLQVEEQFYLTYPLIVAMCSRRALRGFLTGCVIVAPLLRSFLLLLPNSSMARYVLMPCRMDALALGGLVALRMSSPGASPLRPARVRLAAILSGVLAAGVYIFAWYRKPGDLEYDPFVSSIGYTLIDITCAAVLSLVILSPSAAPARMLRWRPLVYTGQIAYGLYLLHAPAAWVVRAAIAHFARIDIAPQSPAGILVLLGAGYAAAALSWRFFESPVLTLKARFTPLAPYAGQIQPRKP
jgi:peptidoglycan/LPS O-acetylase OafA/YrhL